MQTPICDFVKKYAKSNALRMHMPGHKGKQLLGMELYDITEIDGADSLYEASGIIMESERNAGTLFDAHTFYSAEGSSLSIRAMLYLAVLDAKKKGKKPLIAAGRNAHKVFVNTAALLDFEVVWLHAASESYLSCNLSAEELEQQLFSQKEKPTAVYITSPDYLGNMADIGAIAKVCHKHDILLLVDNAHGAYLKFLPESLHPMDLGADICCDSAHKTLPALTGAGYLHLAKDAPEFMKEQAKHALALFGSTSPSYLILQSLDRTNAYLSDGYREKLSSFLIQAMQWKKRILAHGYMLTGDEPLKLTIATKAYGYEGKEFADLLKKKDVVCEFADPDFVVLMLTPEVEEAGLRQIENALYGIEKRTPIKTKPPTPWIPERVMSIRQAMLSPCEAVTGAASFGRTLATANVGCPPAVPILVCGEKIDAKARDAFRYYGIESCFAVIE